jgi:hypothetical protein
LAFSDVFPVDFYWLDSDVCFVGCLCLQLTDFVWSRIEWLVHVWITAIFERKSFGGLVVRSGFHFVAISSTSGDRLVLAGSF